ncbi:MAG: site-specific recombinase [Mitsuaria chitosanitabida]|uniref:site-specific recombinase n=1 Tax=Roseateles chitosanitabidus TaxID=65048 RepID=UPI001B0474D0|nr:site-specific recombinase [Roseateles chitosanitabidus]MBO9687736.1 site-specific recombinase [Roseateles chitosanitabidus]
MARRHGWDLTALLNAAHPQAPLAERNLWLVRLIEWLRHAPIKDAKDVKDDRAAGTPTTDTQPATATPLPVRRLKYLLNLLERNPEHAKPFAAVIASVWADVDAIGLFAEVGFAPRMALWGEFLGRLRRLVLPQTADTRELAELFELLFPHESDEQWINAVDDDLLRRLSLLFADAPDGDWREEMRAAITVLISAVRSAGLSGALRVRMDPKRLASRPFRNLATAWERVEHALVEQDRAALPAALQYLRGLLDECRAAVRSVPEHLEEHGVSVDLMFGVEQMQARLRRVEDLLAVLLADHPQRELLRLVAGLVSVVHERRSIPTLFAKHYSLLARKVAERSAETGEHYITRNREEYGDMLRRAGGGGLVIAGTTFLKFAIMAIGLSAFWGGFWAGVNYAVSFVLILLLHWTVATKQPAMTAPALADKLRHIDSDAGLQSFVDEVAHLFRSQTAGIIGNLALAAPMVLVVQLAAWLALGRPLVGVKEAEYVLHSLTVLGPSLFFAAFTGVLLFASSLIAGWVENWFVFHRLDSAIAWNPRIVATLGPNRARRWSRWWRDNISGLTANISLGLMLGLVPALLGFFGLPVEVRHVTLSTGQLAAAAGALGWDVLKHWPFWLCVISILGTGVLNVGVSFYLAFKVALRSRGIRLADQKRVRAAVWTRMRRQPLSFLIPPKG